VGAQSATDARKRPVGRETIRGVPSAFALMHQIQVPESPVQGKRNGQAGPGDSESRRSLGTDCVEHERNQCRSRDDADHLIEQLRTVHAKNGPDRAQRQENAEGMRTPRYRMVCRTGVRHRG